MEERLEPEVQIADEAKPVSSMVASAQDETLDGSALEVSKLAPEAQQLIHRMMDGAEPYGRDLKINEVKKFGPQHVNVAILRAAGFKGTEIAQITGYGQQMVYMTMLHPYTKKLQHALVPQNGARVIDIRTRIEDYAGDLLDRVFAKALDEEDLDKLGKVTFGLLDRAGYGVKETLKAGTGPIADVPASSELSRLSKALEASDRIRAEIMPQFKSDAPPEVADLAQGSGSAVEAPQQVLPADQGGTHLGSQSFPGSAIRKVG